MKHERIFLVNRHGVAIAMDVRTLSEADRLERIKSKGVLPDGYSDMIPAAPARGPVKSYTPMKLYPKGDQDWELKPAGQLGSDGAPVKSIQRADAFDLMIRQARLSHKGDKADFIPPFTPAQVTMGRHYRNLVERHASAGIQCSSVETVGGGGSGGSSSFIDAVLRDRDQIARIQARIGDGLALEVRRQRKASKRDVISVRRMVDMVCLSDKSLAEVLRYHGWSKRGGSVTTLQSSLADALDRMMGPSRSLKGFNVFFDDFVGLSLAALSEGADRQSYDEFLDDLKKGA